MHPDRGIVCTYRWSDGISMIPDDHNTLTCQSANTNNATREYFHGPGTWNYVRVRPYSTLRLLLPLRLQSVTITTSTTPLLQEPAHFCIRYPMIVPPSASALEVQCWQPFPDGFDSSIFLFD